MSIAQQIFNKAFSPALQTKRSQAFLSGVMATLVLKETGEKTISNFQSGSVEFDAYTFGNRTGLDIWKDYRKQETQS